MLLRLASLVLATTVLGTSACTPPAEEPAPAAPTRPSSVIVIGIDTLRADHLGLYGHDRPTSPFLDSLASEGVVFERAMATSPWTLPSFASIFTGRLQSGHAAGVLLRNSELDWEAESLGPDRQVALDPGAETLAGALAGLGWKTLAVVQNPYLSPAFGIARGFEFYDFSGETGNSRRADQVVDRALAWVAERAPDPFFLFLHLFDPHMPYDAPTPWAGTFTGGIEGGGELPVDGWPQEIDASADSLSEARKGFIAAAYDEEIRFVDSQLERFVTGLRARGLWDDTLVVLTSDHGEELFDHGGFEHGHTLYDELLHVPLVVWGPGIASGRVADPVSIADIAPTVLSAVGLPVAAGIFGRSLWPTLTRGEPVGARDLIAEGTLYGPERKTILQWPHKLIRTERSGRTELYDLDADPGERAPLRRQRERIASLAERLDLLLSMAAEGVRFEATEVDPELREQLRSLGYIR